MLVQLRTNRFCNTKNYHANLRNTGWDRVLNLVKMKNWLGRTYADARDSLGVFSLCRVKN